MRLPNGYTLPATIAVVLHLAAILMAANIWQHNQQPPIKSTPDHIKAKLIALKSASTKPVTAKKAPAQKHSPQPDKKKLAEQKAKDAAKKKAEAAKQKRLQQEKERKAQQKAEKLKQQRLKKQKEEQAKKARLKKQKEEKARKARAAKLKKQREEKAKREREARLKRERQEKLRKQREAEKKIQEAELAALLAEEEDAEENARIAATQSEKVSAIQGVIQNTIENYWSRPPTARKGMVVHLSIQMVPTGEVINVNVIKSSGDSTFDRSAVRAVEKAGRFPEVRQVTPSTFEQNFRSMKLVFNPEDLTG